MSRNVENEEKKFSSSIILSKRVIQTKIYYVYGDYYFNNEIIRHYFIKTWVSNSFIKPNNKYFLGFNYTNEKFNYSKQITIHYYLEKTIWLQSWKIKIEQ